MWLHRFRRATNQGRAWHRCRRYGSLLEAGYGVTVYNGLRDTAVPAQGAEKWIRTVGNATVVSSTRVVLEWY